MNNQAIIAIFAQYPIIQINMNSYIFLENARFFAYHGVGKQEQQVGNEFIINVKMTVDISRAGTTDDVKDTVSYAEVYEAIKSEMNIPSKLLEHVCIRIIRQLFLSFKQIEAIDLKLIKRNPPMGGDLDGAGIQIQCSRSEVLT